MRQSILRAPVINAAIVLGILSLLVYFTLTSPDGSMWSSIGAIVLLVLRVIQLTIALALGLLVGIGVLFGIFFGAVALFDPRAASRMYESLRQTLLVWTAPVQKLFKSEREERFQQQMSALADDLRQDQAQGLRRLSTEVQQVAQEFQQTVAAMTSRLQAVEAATESMASKDELAGLRQEMAEATENLAAIKESVAGLETRIDELAKQSAEADAAAILGDIPERLTRLEERQEVDLTPVETSLSDLRQEMERLAAKIDAMAQEQATSKASTEKGPAIGEHRLLSYFDDEEDRSRLITLVESTLKKDMTYAQVMDYLAKEMGEKGVVISEHPSLAKDFIRQMRRRG